MGHSIEEDIRSLDVLEDLKKKSKALDDALKSLKSWGINKNSYDILKAFKDDIDIAIALEER